MYEGGALPVLSGCSFKDCRWTFGVAAGNTLAFLSALSKGGFRPLVEETLQALLSGSMLQQPNAEDEWTGDASRRPPLPPRIELGFGTFPVPRIVKMPKPRP